MRRRCQTQHRHRIPNMVSERETVTIGTHGKLHTTEALSFRARFTVHPRLIKCDDSHPPPMLPISADRVNDHQRRPDLIER